MAHHSRGGKIKSGIPTISPFEKVYPEFENYTILEKAQIHANSLVGPRYVPARVLQIPTTVSRQLQEVIAAPYPLPKWTANHPKSAQDWRSVVEILNKAANKMLPGLRRRLGVNIRSTNLGGIPAFLLTPSNLRPEHNNRILLHIHGGGFVYYSGQAGTLEATMMAAYGGFKVISVDYRLAPDFPYPAALDDVIAAYRALITVHDPRRVGVFGSSSGGNLTLSLMLRAKAEALQLPAAMALGSPWSDISLSGGGDTIQTLEWIDGNLVSYNGYLHHAALAYANGLDMTVPYLSPLHGNFIGLPPAILTCGTRDLFLSLTAMTHRKLRQMNIIAELHVYEGLAHGQYLYPRLPESKEAFSEIGNFFDRHLS